MATHRQRDEAIDDTEERREAKRKDSGAGNASVGAVDGIGGTGGASGTGGVRAKARAIGDVSSIEADEVDMPAPGSIGKGKSGSRTRQMSDGGLRGKTRGDDSETIPNQESAAQKDAEKQDRS
ncbi:MAG TPA: hypothetical protein VFU22_16150 [Roseiflexaceae bacterium]|nr:hypothetical protein [Roseiflexaceae bacterium]